MIYTSFGFHKYICRVFTAHLCYWKSFRRIPESGQCTFTRNHLHISLINLNNFILLIIFIKFEEFFESKGQLLEHACFFTILKFLDTELITRIADLTMHTSAVTVNSKFVLISEIWYIQRIFSIQFCFDFTKKKSKKTLCSR